MRSKLNNLVRGLLVIAVIFLTVTATHADTWKFAFEEGFSDPQGLYALKFKEEIEKNSNHKIKLYPIGTLGETADAMEQAQAGLLQFIDQSPGYTGAMIPEADVFQVPYLMPSDPEKLDKFFKESKAINEMFPKIYRKHGLELLSIFPEGEQAVTTMKEFRSPADLAGMKIRTMPSTLLLETYKAFGASPIAMTWGELIGALKTNMVDGQENPTVWIEAYGLDELTKVLTYTGHNHYTTAVMANGNFYNKLSSADKKLVQNATAASQKYILEKAKDMDALGLGRIVRSNPDYKIVTLTEKERLLFKEKAKQVEKKFIELAGKKGEEILKQMKADLKAIEAK